MRPLCVCENRVLVLNDALRAGNISDRFSTEDKGDYKWNPAARIGVTPVAMQTGVHYAEPLVHGRASGKIQIQIPPVRVHFLDHPDFPGTPPFLDALFISDGIHHVLILPVPDQQSAIILCSEAASDLVAMFPCATLNVIGAPT